MGWVLPLDKIFPELGNRGLIRHWIVGRENARFLDLISDGRFLGNIGLEIAWAGT